MEWQPIETYKDEYIDGEEVLGAVMPRITRKGLRVGSYTIDIIKRVEHKWTGKAWIKRNGDVYYPTHWLPIPDSFLIDEREVSDV